MSTPTALQLTHEQKLELKNEELRTWFHGWTTIPQAHCVCLRLSCSRNCSMSTIQYSAPSVPTGGTSFWPDSGPLPRKIFGGDKAGLDYKPNRYARQSPDDYVRQFRTERHQVDRSASEKVRKDLVKENDKRGRN